MKRLLASIWLCITLFLSFSLCGYAESSPCTGKEHEKWSPVTVAGELNDGNYVLYQDVEGDLNIVGAVNLCLNGYTLTGSGNQSVITIAQNAILNLCDCSPVQTGTIKGGGGPKGGGIFNGGTLNLYSGTVTGNVLDPHGWGGGVCCENSEFNMYGGYITENAATFGTGVAIISGTFCMYNGEIVNNVYLKPETGTYGEYGGIWVNDTFNMYGGTVYGHGGTTYHSVDVCNSSFFNMRGGYVGTVADGYRFSFYGGQIDAVDATYSMGCTLYQAPEDEMLIGIMGGDYLLSNPEEAEKFNVTGEVEKYTVFVAGEFTNTGIVHLGGKEPEEDSAVVVAVPLGNTEIDPNSFRARNSTCELRINRYGQLEKIHSTPTPTPTPAPTPTPTATATATPTPTPTATATPTSIPTSIPTGKPRPTFPNLGDILDSLATAGKNPLKRPTLILSEDGHELLGVGFLSFEIIETSQKAITYEVGLYDAWGKEIALPGECKLIFPYPEGITINNHHGWRVTITHYGKEQTEVFCSEDGTIEFLPLGLCIRVSSLSPFVIEWEKNAVPETLPQTGDNTSLPMSALGLLLSLAAIYCLNRKRINA